MKTFGKILIVWLLIAVGYAVSLWVFPHREVPFSSVLNQLLHVLLFIISLFIFLRETNIKNKIIFLNFVLFYFFATLQISYRFFGVALLSEYKYAGHMFAQYSSMVYILFFSIAIVYLVIDLLFRDFKIYQKYLATFIIVLSFFIFYFYPFLTNPFYLYSTEDIQQWKSLSQAVTLDNDQSIQSSVELASRVKLQTYKNGLAVGGLYPEENMRRIEVLIPYLEDDNYKVLLWKPLYFNMIYMNILLIGFILLFFGYQYKKDPPQGAYIDKIMFLFLLFISTEILHQWGYIKSVEFNSLTELFIIGQYITAAIQAMIVLFLVFRLKFISSVQGEFYETELAVNPQKISRWRDWVDNIVIAHFFDLKVFNSRLFQNPFHK